MTIQDAKHPDISSKGMCELTNTNNWPDGFYETTAGAWVGEPLVREPQGDYEQRLELNDQFYSDQTRSD